MPKYEYACKSCGERTEVKQSFTDDPLTQCATCGGVLRKVFSSPGIVLRGPGFYRTDHRSPYRPDGTRPAERDKDREPTSSSDAKSSESDSSGGDTKESKSSGDSKSSSGDSKRSSGDSKGSSEKSGSGGSSGDNGGSKDTARTA